MTGGASWKQALRRPGVPAALGAALLFGAGTPLAKLLLTGVGPWLLAGLLYLGSGIGLTLYRRVTRQPPVRLPRGEALWLAGGTGAYFSVAPFFGAVMAIAMGEPVTLPLMIVGALMALGVWLHLSERHIHEHTHEAMEHEHVHVHDEHHQHDHDPPVPPGTRHTHLHRHEPLTHTHAHYPDAHHRHDH